MDDTFDFSSIHSIAIAPPNYVPRKNSKVTPALLEKMFFQEGEYSRLAKKVKFVSYSEVAADIKNQTGVDLSTMDARKARECYRQNVGKYADAYLVVTIANDSRVVAFYDLYSAKTGAYLYSCEIIGGDFRDDNVSVLSKFTQKFYGNLQEFLSQASQKNKK